MVVSVRDGTYMIHTDLPPDVLRDRLRALEPWRHAIHFANGVKTTDFQTAKPFAWRPSKWWVFEPHVPEEAIRGGKALDVGFNAGYHSLLLRSRYGMEVTGLDVAPKHFKAAELLKEVAGLDNITFVREDATFYRRPGHYDLILHLGTLYHLRHPFLALESAAASLKSGGFLALETLTPLNGDPTLCTFFPHGYAGDESNWWALGPGAVVGMLEASGLGDIKVVHEWTNEVLSETGMGRTSFVARKPAT